MVLISTAIYYAERNGPKAEWFPDIPSSMWWTVITFTSVGYGDVYTISPLGKFWAGIVMLNGVIAVSLLEILAA